MISHSSRRQPKVACQDRTPPLRYNKSPLRDCHRSPHSVRIHPPPPSEWNSSQNTTRHHIDPLSPCSQQFISFFLSLFGRPPQEENTPRRKQVKNQNETKQNEPKRKRKRKTWTATHKTSEAKRAVRSIPRPRKSNDSSISQHRPPMPRTRTPRLNHSYVRFLRRATTVRLVRIDTERTVAHEQVPADFARQHNARDRSARGFFHF